MSAMRRILMVASPLLLFGIGLVQFLRRTDWATLRPLAVEAPLEPQAGGGGGWWWLFEDPWHVWPIFLMFVPLAILLLWIGDLFSHKTLTLATESGHPLKIRAAAVDRYLHDCLSTLPFVRGARIESRSSGAALQTHVRVWVVAHDKLDNLQETLLRKIVLDARQGLGLTKVEEPEILVEEVRTRRGKPAGDKPAVDATRDQAAPRTPEPAAGEESTTP